MSLIFSLLKTRIALVIAILIGFMILLYFLTPKTPSPATPTQTPPPITSVPGFFETKIGDNQSQVEKLPNQSGKESLNNQTVYSYKTPALARDNIIIVENGQVVFERSVTIEPDYTHPNLSELLDSLGTPEKEFKGSLYYGEEYITYIYASKGISVLGNPLTNEVFEINQFKPTTVLEYERLWGQDLHTFEGNQEQEL